MKSILIHVKNTLLLQSLQLALKKTNDFKVDIENGNDCDQIVDRCEQNKYDILFMDIARSYSYGFDERKNVISKIKALKINTKIAIFCDSNSEPEMAAKVKDLKALNIIDTFFYESVNDKYMTAVLETL